MSSSSPSSTQSGEQEENPDAPQTNSVDRQRSPSGDPSSSRRSLLSDDSRTSPRRATGVVRRYYFLAGLLPPLQWAPSPRRGDTYMSTLPTVSSERSPSSYPSLSSTQSIDRSSSGQRSRYVSPVPSRRRLSLLSSLQLPPLSRSCELVDSYLADVSGIVTAASSQPGRMSSSPSSEPPAAFATTAPSAQSPSRNWRPNPYATSFYVSIASLRLASSTTRYTSSAFLTEPSWQPTATLGPFFISSSVYTSVIFQIRIKIWYCRIHNSAIVQIRIGVWDRRSREILHRMTVKILVTMLPQ